MSEFALFFGFVSHVTRSVFGILNVSFLGYNLLSIFMTLFLLGVIMRFVKRFLGATRDSIVRDSVIPVIRGTYRDVKGRYIAFGENIRSQNEVWHAEYRRNHQIDTWRPKK